ncbi:Ulp1 family isopeptidase [Chlamydiifrater phoenicopteri]|uniref:Ulp1 family isopeptidase n=1 Tax=Chlamydiifrater phoenicopteri TaxID=2681469 RepID=UPI001BCB4B0B|nr:Ulp1 family isopeptidase [Chlamydiifrater phoenicopteri]
MTQIPKTSLFTNQTPALPSSEKGDENLTAGKVLLVIAAIILVILTLGTILCCISFGELIGEPKVITLPPEQVHPKKKTIEELSKPAQQIIDRPFTTPRKRSPEAIPSPELLTKELDLTSLKQERLYPRLLKRMSPPLQFSTELIAEIVMSLAQKFPQLRGKEHWHSHPNDVHKHIERKIEAEEIFPDQLIPIPYLFSPTFTGGAANHWVLVALDMQLRKILYFNSLCNYTGQTELLKKLQETAELLSTSYPGDRPFTVENITANTTLQTDGVSCGAFTCWFLYNHLQNPLSSTQETYNRISSEKANRLLQQFREHMAAAVLHARRFLSDDDREWYEAENS